MKKRWCSKHQRFFTSHSQISMSYRQKPIHMKVIKIVLKIIFVLFLVIFLMMASLVIYIQVTKPTVPDFEQIKYDVPLKYKESESIEWTSYEELPSLTLTVLNLDNEAQWYWLDAISSSFCHIPSAIIYDRLSLTKKQVLLQTLSRGLKFYYNLPIEFGTPARPFTNLLRGCAFMTDLSHQWKDEQIIEAYLNISFYGNGKYGIHAASQFYFKKLPRELNLQETVVLLRLQQSSVSYFKNPDELFNESCRFLDFLDIPEEEKNCDTLKPYIDTFFEYQTRSAYITPYSP